MSLAFALLSVLALAMLAALALLVWMLRAVMHEAHSFEDDQIERDAKRRNMHAWLNPIAWWRRHETLYLFYQRDAKGRFRKIRRY